MATALQHTEVDISLDLSTDADISDMPENHDANTNQATEDWTFSPQAQMGGHEEDADDSVDAKQQVDTQSDQHQDAQEAEQYDSVSQALAEDENQDTINDYGEWDMDGDAEENAAPDERAGSEGGHALDEESTDGLDQGVDQNNGSPGIENDDGLRDDDAYGVNVDNVSGTEPELARVTEDRFPQGGTSEDLFQEIDYEDEEPAGPQSATVHDPHDHEQETTGLNDNTAVEPENSWLETKESDKAGAIDEYHRSLQDQALDEILQADSSAASLDASGEADADDDADLPEVIVSWHGVEYPMFYDSPGSEGKQCFFEDAGLLQCAMEKLLESFRAELSSDLVDTDELVLQINEMGLEFAESTNPEHYRDITLGSIMQVFNDLVRNKDPEASRPLYAYLITRTKCSTRWQSLIEDAYQGKNIDEVSIYFPMDQNDAQKEVDGSENTEERVEGQVGDMEMGEYFTAESVPEGDATTADDSAIAPDEMAAPNGEQSYDESDAAEEEFAAGEDDFERAAEVIPGPDLSTARESSVRSPGEVAVSGVAAQDALNDEEGIKTIDNSHETTEGSGEQKTHNGQLGDPQDDAAEPVVAEVTHADDGGMEAGNHDDVYLDETRHDNEFSETSGTATLDGDDHPQDFSAEIDFNADINPELELNIAPATGQAGELDEIDWRDYAGQEDGDDIPDPTATSAKRPRSDEDDAADAEDGQEIKRRRSEA